MPFISIMKGGFFKLGKPEGFRLFDTGQVLRTWNLGSCKVGLGTLEENCLLRGDGPNRVSRVFCVGRKIPESLAVVQPFLFLFGGGVGVVDGGDIICLSEKGVPLGAEFLEGLGIDEFLEFCFELLFWRLGIAFNNFDGIPCVIKSYNFCFETHRVYRLI